MPRRLALAVLALPLLLGCAGPTRLAERSENKLSSGDHWRAWTLATKALDKAPANARARAAAAAAASSIAEDWQRRILALASVDSLAAAEQVLAFTAFRTDAVPYTTVAVSPEWSRDEEGLRQAAARVHYQRGTVAMGARRPKKACVSFSEVERFDPGFRDAGTRADKNCEKAVTRIAIVPFLASSGNGALGRDVAADWRDELARRMAPPDARFTRILGSEGIEGTMTVSQLGRMSRDEAVRLGREAGADRVVWGSIGGINSETQLHLFRDEIARRVVEKDAAGHEVVRWVNVPIEVIARVRTVTVSAEYEVIATRGGASVARQRVERATSARVVWTSFAPEGDLASYSLVSETAREADPERAKQIDVRWKSVCGENTSLRQVLEARRTTRGPGRYQRDVLPRFIAGAAFVFLEDLPPVEDLAFAALANGWQPLRDDLIRLDPIDDVDLGVAMAGDDRR